MKRIHILWDRHTTTATFETEAEESAYWQGLNTGVDAVAPDAECTVLSDAAYAALEAIDGYGPEWEALVSAIEDNDGELPAEADAA